LAVRYPDRRNPLAAGSSHGIQVSFAGDQIAGFGPWLDDPHEKELTRSVQSFGLLGITRVVWILLLVVLLALPFLKRYHEGEIGVRRGAQIFVLAAVSGALMMLLLCRVSSEDSGFGFASREQNTWLVVLFQMVYFILPAATLAFFAWSVGESICRERWGHKLAAFDALFKGDLLNETVARSAFRGWMAGLAAAGGGGALLLGIRGRESHRLNSS